jgi:hypothetical protein
MGRQVNFYMTEEDEKEFIDFAKGTGDVKIWPYHMTSPDESLRTLPEQESRKIWSEVFLSNDEIYGRMHTRFYENPNVHIVNPSDSPVIQFSRSFMSESGLKRGIIWAEFTWLDRDVDEIVPKDPAFVKWYEKIARWLKRRYRMMEPLTYAGPGALRFQEEGGELLGLH